jgi:hypothetical protein
MSKPHKFGQAGDADSGERCPPPAIWGELAAGLMTRDAAFEYLDHAGSCPACAEELQYALYAMADTSAIPDEIRQHLATSSEEWQRKFAAQIAERKNSDAPAEIVRQALPQPGRFRGFVSRAWTRMVIAVGKKKPDGS